MSAQILVLIATMGFLLPSFAQEEPNRLLPDSFTRSIKFSWRQDGRVVDIEIWNPKEKWVITQLLFEVHFPQPSDKPNGPEVRSNGRTLFRPLTDAELCARGWPAKVPCGPVSRSVKVEIQPGKSGANHLELEPNFNASGLLLLEARGREQTRIERVKNAIW